MNYVAIAAEMAAGWREFGCIAGVPNSSSPSDPHHERPAPTISLGLSCWLWDWGRRRAIARLAYRTGVTLQLTQHFRGLRREIECVVSGENVDEFIGEFVRHG